jgi:hypothetical protein
MNWSETNYILNKLKSLISNLTIGTASVDDVLDGKTFASGSENNMLVGAMPNHSGETVEATKVSSSNSYTALTMPEKGYYDTDSKIRILSNSIVQSHLVGIGSGYTCPYDGFVYLDMYATVTNHDNSGEMDASMAAYKSGQAVIYDSIHIGEWAGGTMSRSLIFEVKAGNIISWSFNVSNNKSIAWSTRACCAYSYNTFK